MKTFKILIFLLTVFLVSSITYAGDLGGGGSSKLQLTKEMKEALLRQGNQQAAFAVWVNQLDQQAQAEVYKKVFESHILPQLINK